ncbi:hypothetical protein AKO1_003375, partial [Acrasis kona]
MHKKLPPSNVEMIPFNLFKDYEEKDDDDTVDNAFPTIPTFQISTREDIERLKRKSSNYIDDLQDMMDKMFDQEPGEYV